MFDIALLIFFSVMAYRIATAINRETKIFREFQQPRTLALLAMLFPFGPLVLLIGLSRLPFPLAFIGAAACYIPALYIARRLGLAFERAGTDRVKAAQDAISQAVSTSFVGLIYVSIYMVFSVAVAFI
jgi:hypothetical protein